MSYVQPDTTGALYEFVKLCSAGFVSAVITYFFSQRKYKFEKLYDKELEYLEAIFEKVVQLEDSLNKYIDTTGSMIAPETLQARKDELKPIKEMFFDLRKFFRKKEIILDQDCLKSIDSFIDVSIGILSELTTSNISSELGDDTGSYNYWHRSFEIMNDEFGKAKSTLKAAFTKVIQNQD